MLFTFDEDETMEQGIISGIALTLLLGLLWIVVRIDLSHVERPAATT